MMLFEGLSKVLGAELLVFSSSNNREILKRASGEKYKVDGGGANKRYSLCKLQSRRLSSTVAGD